MTDAVRTVALGEQLAGLLRNRIVRGRIPAGTHLVEDVLAADHNVSRGPVRDALRSLLAEGLLETRRRGFYTKAFGQAEVDELYEIRIAAEHLACRLAIQGSSDEDWEAARLGLADMARNAKTGDQHAYARADLRFHTQFYVLSRNSRLLSLWHQYQPTFATLLDITNAQDSDLRPSFEDHQYLLKLAEEGDWNSFSVQLEDHLAGSHRRLSSAINLRDDPTSAPLATTDEERQSRS